MPTITVNDEPKTFSDPITVTPKDGELKWSEQVRLHGDLMILAFQTDMTRVASLMFEHPFGLTYPEIGVDERHHTLSHHDNDKAKIADLIKIERFQIEQVAYVIGRMKSLMDGNGSLLDICRGHPGIFFNAK